jgi:hypothetical protein
MDRHAISSLLLALMMFAGASAPAHAQTGTPAAWQATPASVLKNALRATSAAQERYFAAHHLYAPSADQLGLTLEPGVRVIVLGAGTAGWQAKATFDGRRGRSCVVFVGTVGDSDAPRTDGDHEMAGEEGIPLCDRMQ